MITAVPNLISVIITTYDRADALDLVLRGLSRQHDRGFEVVVADDGSDAATATVIDGWQRRLGAPLVHVWRPHQGFRIADIRNRATLASEGDYCIFIDGDCIPRRDFIAAHRRLAELGWFVTGNRVLLSQELTAAVFRDGLEPETWTLPQWIGIRRQGGINRLNSVVPLPLGPIRKLGWGGWKEACGCNLAFWRADLDRVDGFDASFCGWGREDSDLLLRSFRAGLRRKDGRFATGVLHLWHPPADRAGLAQNDAKLDALVHSTRMRAMSGLAALRNSSEDPPTAGTGNVRVQS
jgi:glycosyltransferase involved in cell wall biosynthesis